MIVAPDGARHIPGSSRALRLKAKASRGLAQTESSSALDAYSCLQEARSVDAAPSRGENPGRSSPRPAIPRIQNSIDRQGAVAASACANLSAPQFAHHNYEDLPKLPRRVSQPLRRVSA
jgi:hypothetical protein